MIDKSPAVGPNQVRVTFQLPSSIWAERVTLVGEFNEWSRTATPLRRDADGAWRVSLELAAGRDYQFRYLVDDDHWVNDYNADSYVANAYGSDNSVVHAAVPEPASIADATAPVPDETAPAVGADGITPEEVPGGPDSVQTSEEDPLAVADSGRTSEEEVPAVDTRLGTSEEAAADESTSPSAVETSPALEAELRQGGGGSPDDVAA